MIHQQIMHRKVKIFSYVQMSLENGTLYIQLYSTLLTQTSIDHTQHVSI